jgi:inner membrane protein
MSWWGWTIAGAILLGAELIFVNAQFYLVFIGSAAIVVGILTALAPELLPWAQWALFAALAILSMVTFRSRVDRWLHRQSPPVRTGHVGGVITLQVSLAPGESCQAEHAGTYWTVRNDSGSPIPAGSEARIASVNGLTLLVRPA